MLRKLILACAATVALGAAAFTPSAASAHGWHGGHGGWHGGCYVRRLVPTPFGYRYRLVNRCY